MEKIALVISSLSSGGGERVVATLSQEFAKRYDVTVILFDSANIDYKYGGEIIDIDCPEKTSFLGKTYNLLKRAYRLKKLFRQKQFDHIFGFMESANYPSILASRDTIASLHIDFHFLNPIERLLVSNIYPAVPLGHPKKFLIAVGRLTYQKHFDLMIDAFAESKAQENCDLIILGEGELRADLEQQISNLDLKGKVHLPGRLKNPFNYMKNAEFMVLSSRAEGFPMVLIEALSLDCPVVATDCPTGPREIIEKDVNGLLIPMKNKEVLTQSIDTLFFDQALRQSFSEKARGSVNHLSVENICKEWIKLSSS